jgi:Flp pilus assembly protein TadG
MTEKADGDHNDQSGAAALEFALVLPVFVLLTTGMLAYGVYFGAAHSTAQLAADAARASIGGLTDQERGELAREHVARNSGVYTLLRPQHVSAIAAPSPDDATDFRVTVRYDASTLPIWRFASFLPLPNRIIERSATIRRGGF